MELFLRGRSIAALTEQERDTLESAISERRDLPARKTLLDRGETLNRSTMLVAGYMIRYIDDDQGLRQVVAFHVPGDFVDLHAYPLRHLDHSIATLTQSSVAYVPHDRLDALIERLPLLGRKLWASTLLDAALHREWLFRFGRLSATGRVAHFFAETEARMRAIRMSDGTHFPLPVTQLDLAEITGLTNVHVNRVLRALREERVCTFRAGAVEIHDPVRLARTGQFDPAYLYLTQSVPRPGVAARSRKEAAGYDR